ncbi:MAG: hypothetical protein ABW090_16655 [Sedimenticola sp.]
MTDDEMESGTGPGEQFSLDDQGIPILNEVVENLQPGRDQAPSDEPLPAPQTLYLPNHDELIQLLRKQLREELEPELDGLIEQAAEEAISKTMVEFSAIAQAELTRLLKRRTGELLEEILKKQLVEK